MALLGCFVAPHPPIIVPEVGGAQLFEVEPTVHAMRELQNRAAALEPDTIVLLSPHAPLMYDHMGVSLASSYEGSLAYFRAPHVRIQATGDQELARAIAESAAKYQVPAGFNAADGDVVDLDHGTMVPLVYILGGLATTPKLVLLAFSQLSLQQHLRFGEAVGRALLDAPGRVLYVASADLSHRLLPQSPNGYDPLGLQFDRAVADAFAAGDWKALTSIPGNVVMAAGECGYRSLMVLAGIVRTVHVEGLLTENQLLSYEGPFGVGYLVGEVKITEASHQRGTTQ